MTIMRPTRRAMAMDDLWVGIAFHEGREIAADSGLDQVFPKVVCRFSSGLAGSLPFRHAAILSFFKRNNRSNRGCNQFLKYIFVFVRGWLPALVRVLMRESSLFFERMKFIFPRLFCIWNSAKLFILSVHRWNFSM